MSKQRKWKVVGIFSASESGTLFETRNHLSHVVETCATAFDEFHEEVARSNKNLLGLLIIDKKTYKSSPGLFNLDDLFESSKGVSIMATKDEKDPKFLTLRGKKCAALFKLADSNPVVLNANFTIKETDNGEEAQEEDTSA